MEVLRIPVRLDQQSRDDVRRDIELEWRSHPAPVGAGTDRLVSAADIYERTPSGKKLFEKAMEAMTKKDFRQAVSLLNQIVGTDSGDYQAWTELGTVYFRQEKNSEAEKAFRNALAAKPDYRLALLNLGKLYFSRKNYEAAIDLLTKAAEATPRSAETNLLLGESYLQIKKGSKAVGYLNEAIRLDPAGMAEAHLRLATLYRAAGLKDKAVAEYEQFLAKRPDHPDKEKIRQFIAENKKQ
ncbi:MAG TPA: tetratricopeptide repeat protein [Blastocatellia bacterium]|nr:tetratricopeptide repeat protein [Blastocatellia bacterium]